MQETIFTKIIKGEIPSVKIYEDDICIAIMDKFPIYKGQSLIIPKEEIDYLFNLDNEKYSHLFSVAKKIIHATDKALNPFRTCLVVEGFEIPHAHIKIFPVNNAELKTSGGNESDNDNLKEIANKIKNHL